MIDGDWGCGKTYLTKEIIIKAIEAREDKFEGEEKNSGAKHKRKQIIYISLYGLESRADIEEQIYFQIIQSPKLLDKISSSKAAGAIGKAASTVFSGLASAVSVDFESVKKGFLDTAFESADKERLVFFFDDLERCGMDINKVLGYINGFVEHDGIKTIIIANENEIGILGADENRELRFLAAAHPSINYSKIDEAAKQEKEDSFESAFFRSSVSSDKGSNSSVDVDIVNERTHRIFSGNALYKQIKEKLIGTTTRYQPNLEVVIGSLCSKFIPEVQSVIKRNIQDIIFLMERKNHRNLRTLQSAFQVYQNIFRALSSQNVSDDCHDDLLQYSVFSSILHKNGEEMREWEEGTDWGSVPIGKNIFMEGIDGFRFIDNLVYHSKFSQDNACSVVERFIKFKTQIAKKDDDELQIFRNWRSHSEQEIRAALKAVEANLQHPGYDFNLYPQILAIASCFVCNSIFDEQEAFEGIVKAMENSISAYGKPIELDRDSQHFNRDDIAKLYQKYYDPIKQLMTGVTEQADRSVLNDILLNNDWSSELRNITAKSRDAYLTKRQFFALIDVPVLLKKIEEGSSLDVWNMLFCINNIYSSGNFYEFFEEDYENLTKLKKGLDGFSEFPDAVKRCNFVELKDQVAEKVDRLEAYKERKTVQQS